MFVFYSFNKTMNKCYVLQSVVATPAKQSAMDPGLWRPLMWDVLHLFTPCRWHNQFKIIPQ